MDLSSNKFYKVQVYCINCAYSGQAEILKGKPVPNHIICPNCECETASKHIPTPNTIPYKPINFPLKSPPWNYPRLTVSESPCIEPEGTIYSVTDKANHLDYDRFGQPIIPENEYIDHSSEH